MVHDLISKMESNQLKDIAKGRMKSTPYRTGGPNLDFSRRRTSKVMYINEKIVSKALPISKRTELVTNFKLKDDMYGSENFQVMNYGMGGRISLHSDSIGVKKDKTSTEQDKYGGLRIMTFMLYLSHVKAGGNTIFPQIGLTVEPEEGSALFWFNINSKFEFDSRVFHLGCPVLFGNKWIANKWVKILPQVKNYPCSTRKDFFSVRKNKKHI